MRKRRAGGEIQKREGLRIAHELMPIDESQEQLVVAVRREAVLVVEILADGESIQPIEPQYLLAHLLRAGHRVIARQRRHPLSKSSARGESRIILVPVEIRIVVVPAAQICP